MSEIESKTDFQEKSSNKKESQIYAAVGYLGFLCFVPLIFKKDDEFTYYHAKQALTLFILELATVVLKIVPVLGDLIWTFSFVVLGSMSVVAIFKVFKNERWEIPLIGEIAAQIKI